MNEKVLVCGSLARASGNLKAVDRYAAAEQVVLSLAPHHPEYAACTTPRSWTSKKAPEKPGQARRSIVSF
jgi:hypothetical protein